MAKIGLVAAGAAAVAALAAGVYFLSQDEKASVVVKFDPAVHDKKFLLEVLEELKIEYASLYLHWHNMLVKMRKEKGEVNNNILDQIKMKLEQLTNEIDGEVMEKFGISQALFEEVQTKFEDDKASKDILKNIASNYEKLFQFERPNFEFDYPEEFTRENYTQFLTVVYKKFRYEVYNKLQELTSGSPATDEQMKKAIETSNLTGIKEDVYTALGYPTIGDEKISRTIMKTYLNHIVEPTWHQAILDTQKAHKEKLFKLAEGGKWEDAILIDPLQDYLQELEKIKEAAKSKTAEEKKKEAEDRKIEDEEAAKAPTGPGFNFIDEDAQKKFAEEYLAKMSGKAEEPKTEEIVEEPKTEEVEETKVEEVVQEEDEAVPEEPDNKPVRSAAPVQEDVEEAVQEEKPVEEEAQEEKPVEEAVEEPVKEESIEDPVEESKPEEESEEKPVEEELKKEKSVDAEPIIEDETDKKD